MKRSESYIVTDTGNIVNQSILEEYSIKSSKGLDTEDGFNYKDVVEPPAPPKLLTHLLDINTWHKSCVEAIASDASGAGYTLIPKPEVEEPMMEQKERITEFFNSLRPNINKLLYQREYDAESVGYGLLEIVREAGGRDAPITDIKHYPAHTFRRCADGIRVQQRVGVHTRYFVIMGANHDENGTFDVHFETGKKHYEGLPEHLRANEVIWKNRPNAESKLYGKAPATPSIGAIYADHNRARYNIEFFKNYGIPAMYVTITGDFDPGILDPEDPDYDVRNTLQYRITEQLRQVIKNPHSAMVLQIPSEGEDGNVKVDIKPLSTDTKEASFRLFRKDNRDEVVASHHMDPNRVGITDAGKLGASNSEMTNNAYRTTTIAPLIRENEADINYLLSEHLGVTDWQFKIITTDEEKKHVDIDKTIELVKVGLMTPNEARELIGEDFGLARIEENQLLDEFYYNGEPLKAKFQTDSTLFGVDTILEGLENNWEDEALEEEISSEEDSAFQKVIKSIRQSYHRN